MPLPNKTVPLPPLNIIERHADQFVDSEMGYEADLVNYAQPRKFINELKAGIFDYNKNAERLIYLERVRYRIKIGMDNHDGICLHFQRGESCDQHNRLEDVLFFIQNLIDEYQNKIEPGNITPENKEQLEQILKDICRDMEVLKTSAEFSYNDILNEIQEIKTLYYLNKKTLSEVIVGKFSEMVAGGVVSETLSKGIVEVIGRNYHLIIESLR